MENLKVTWDKSSSEELEEGELHQPDKLMAFMAQDEAQKYESISKPKDPFDNDDVLSDLEQSIDEIQ